MSDPINAKIAALEKELAALKQDNARHTAAGTTYYASDDAMKSRSTTHAMAIPEHGFNAAHVKDYILQEQELDFKPRLNTSSYVNVVMEPEERDVAYAGTAVNIADASVYPSSVKSK